MLHFLSLVLLTAIFCFPEYSLFSHQKRIKYGMYSTSLLVLILSYHYFPTGTKSLNDVNLQKESSIH